MALVDSVSVRTSMVRLCTRRIDARTRNARWDSVGKVTAGATSIDGDVRLGEGVLSNVNRRRLVDGLAVSIRERGFRDTRISDIVRHARTSRRTFYEEFASKDECYVALLEATDRKVKQHVLLSVDPEAAWQTQVRQAIEAFIEIVASEPEITLSWIREFPALGGAVVTRQMQRDATESLVRLLLRLTERDEWRRAGLAPIPRQLAVLLIGGLRELTATTVEDGNDVRDVTETAVAATIALLAST